MCKHPKMQDNTMQGQQALQIVAISLFPDPSHPNEYVEGFEVPCLKPNHNDIASKGKKATFCTGKYQGSFVEKWKGKSKIVAS